MTPRPQQVSNASTGKPTNRTLQGDTCTTRLPNMPASLFTVMRDDVTLPVRVQSAGALGEWTDRCKDKRSHDRSDFIAKKIGPQLRRPSGDGNDCLPRVARPCANRTSAAQNAPSAFAQLESVVRRQCGHAATVLKMLTARYKMSRFIQREFFTGDRPDSRSSLHQSE